LSEKLEITKELLIVPGTMRPFCVVQKKRRQKLGAFQRTKLMITELGCPNLTLSVGLLLSAGLLLRLITAILHLD
jgi:hypothetical protein